MRTVAQRAVLPTVSDAGFRLLFVGVLLAIALGAADQMIVTTALPAIARELHGLERLSWIVVAYMLTSTSVTLVYGKLSDVYGRRRLMLIAVGGFVVTSVFCAIAQTVPQLIAARAVQGLAGGGLIVIAQATIADFVSPRERGKYQAYVTLVWTIASVAGPPLGGFFVDHLSWRWAFWINLPLGILAYLIFARSTGMRGPGEGVQRRIDYAGGVLFMGAVTAFLLVCTWAGTAYAWSAPPVLGTAAAGMLLLAAFVAVEFRAAEPMLPPRVLARNNIRLADATGFVVSMLVFAGIVLLPVFLQLVTGVSASTSGALLIPFLLGTCVSSFACGQFMRRTGQYRWLMTPSLTLAALGLALMATLGAAATHATIALDTGLMGLGIGTCFPVLNVMAQNAAEPRDVGVAVSTVTFFRSLGGAFGSAIFWSILLAVFTGGLSAGGAHEARALLAAGAHAGLGEVAPAERATIAVALDHAFRVVFAIAAGVALAGAALTLFISNDPLKSGHGEGGTPRSIRRP